MSTAQDRVLNTPELFSHILHQLPPRDLLLAQLISRHFHHQISHSPPLQRYLYLHSTPSDPHRVHLATRPKHHQETWQPHRPNPTLTATFPHFFRLPTRDVRGACAQYNTWHHTVLKQSPWAARPLAFARKGASWRRMQIANPPITHLHVLSVTQNPGGDTLAVADLITPGDAAQDLAVTVEAGPGLRMGTLHDLVTTAFLTDAWDTFAVDWAGAGPEEHSLDYNMPRPASPACCSSDNESCTALLRNNTLTLILHRTFRTASCPSSGTTLVTLPGDAPIHLHWHHQRLPRGWRWRGMDPTPVAEREAPMTIAEQNAWHTLLLRPRRGLGELGSLSARRKEMRRQLAEGVPVP